MSDAAEPDVSIEVSAGPPALPEVTWVWRRVFTYCLTLICALLLAFIIHKLADVPSLRAIAFCLVGLIALQSLLYIAGATVTDLVRLARAVDLHCLPFRKGAA